MVSHLTRLGLLPLLSFVVTCDDVVRCKAAPDAYRLALRRAGTTAAGSLAIEDSVPGIRAARAAGLCCVAVPNGSGIVLAADHPADLAIEVWTSLCPTPRPV